MTDTAPHILIVQSPYYAAITEQLLQGSIAELEARGATHEILSVPGAFEIPAAIAMARHETTGDGTSKYDGYIALGCVIRGETSHYDYVCGESARALMNLSVDHCLAIGYGILTVENEAQAMARARVSEKNKGRDAADACLTMAALRRRFAARP